MLQKFSSGKFVKEWYPAVVGNTNAVARTTSGNELPADTDPPRQPAAHPRHVPAGSTSGPSIMWVMFIHLSRGMM